MEESRIDKTIYTGRPENTEGRLEKEIAVYDFLDSLGIEYKRADHEALMTMEACEAVDQLLGAQICKNLFLCNRQKTDFYLLLMPGEKPFKTKFLSKQIGTARLSFADGEQMEEYLNITPGSLSLMGLIFDKEKKVHLVIGLNLVGFCGMPARVAHSERFRSHTSLLKYFLEAACTP